MRARPVIFWLIAAAWGLGGCTSVPRDAGFADVEKVVAERTGEHPRWRRDAPEDAEAAEKVKALLRDDLTADSAVQISLLGDPSLQVLYEELGISQADLVQAGLLKNPVFAASVRFPDRPPSAANIGFSVVQDFLDVFMVPLRKKLAAIQFEQAKLRVAHAVLQREAEVRSTFHDLQGLQQAIAMRRIFAQAAETAADLARRQHQAGNVNDLDLAMQEAGAQEAKLRVTRAEAELALHRERLNRLMGLKGQDVHWRVSTPLGELPATETDLADLESVALSKRLDLDAARKEADLVAQSLVMTRRRLFGSVNVGIDTERDSDRQRVTGPTLELDLPVFDQQQAAVARLEAQLRQARRRAEAMELDVRYEVRSARERLLAARATAERYRDDLIPLRSRVVSLSRDYYNAMLIGTFALVQAKQQEVDTRADYVEALRDYWTARAELERAVGMRLPAGAPAAPSKPPTEIQPKQDHPMHHPGDMP